MQVVNLHGYISFDVSKGIRLNPKELSRKARQKKNAPEFPGAFMLNFLSSSVPVVGTFDGLRDLNNPILLVIHLNETSLNGPVAQRLA